MSLDLVSWLAAILVLSAVVLKMLVGHAIGAQRRDLARLGNQRDQVRASLEEVRKQRGVVKENLEFYESRRLEAEEEMAESQGELEQLEESTRMDLEFLGYDDAFIDEAIRTGELSDGAPGGEAPTAEEKDDEAAADAPRTEPAEEYYRPDASIDPASPVAVVPPTGRDADRLFLPDAIVTELLSRDVNVIDRSSLMQRLRDGDEDLQSILETEQYSRLGGVIDLKALIIVNSIMRGAGVGSATCRVVALPSGEILMSTSYEQPGRTDQSPDFEPLTRTAHHLAEVILGIIHP